MRILVDGWCSFLTSGGQLWWFCATNFWDLRVFALFLALWYTYSDFSSWLSFLTWASTHFLMTLQLTIVIACAAYTSQWSYICVFCSWVTLYNTLSHSNLHTKSENQFKVCQSYHFEQMPNWFSVFTLSNHSSPNIYFKCIRCVHTCVCLLPWRDRHG